MARSALPNHKDLQTCDENFTYLREGNIMWHSSYFEFIQCGFESFQCDDYPHRGLLWARLSVKGTEGIKLFVCTTHLPWCGSENEILTGLNPRIPAAEIIAASICRLSKPSEEILVLGGDFNEDFHPLRIFRDRLGVIDVFEQLDLIPPITHPVRPSDSREELRVRTLHVVAII